MSTENEVQKETNETEKTEEKKVFELPHTVKLKHPFQYGDRMITQLTVNRRIKAKDATKIKGNGSVEDIIWILHKVCGEFKGVIEELDLEDLNGELSQVIQSFLSSGEK
jgi:hypothetical protein